LDLQFEVSTRSDVAEHGRLQPAKPFELFEIESFGSANNNVAVAAHPRRNMRGQCSLYMKQSAPQHAWPMLLVLIYEFGLPGKVFLNFCTGKVGQHSILTA
jgi:hypothetical protein